MVRKQNIYSFLLVGILAISFGFRSSHFLEHLNDEKSPKHFGKNIDNSQHTDHSHDCSLCDFTLSSFCKIDFFSFEPLYLNLFNEKPNTICVRLFSCLKHNLSSLRAPPFLT